MSKVCIDARMWGVKHTGIGRYIENLIDNLPISPEVEVVLIVSPEINNEPKLAKYKKYVAKHYIYSLTSLFEMFWLFLKVKPDLVHIPHLNAPFFWPGKMVVTVHDLIKHYSTGRKTSTHGPVMYWIKQLEYLAMTWAVVNRADHIITPTNYWKSELIKRFNISPKKITVTYEGVSPDWKRTLKVKPYRSIPLEPYLLYVGNLYPHKSVDTLIAAAEELKMPVAIVCARPVFQNRLPKSEYVKYLGHLKDDELIAVYSQAEVFVFPSLIEGFGLPGLEAMVVGTPVIAARSSCLPEVYEDAALFFEPQNVSDLVSKIKHLMSDSSLKKKLIQKGKLQVKKYSWATMANQTWQIYQSQLR